MGTKLLGLLYVLAACGDNYDTDAVVDATTQDDVRPTDSSAGDAALQLQILTPSPYVKREDSPFKGLTTWYVEDFEDHLLDDVPGVTDNGGVSKTSVSPPAIVDSVDDDDDAVDGKCQGCESWYSPQGELRFTFTGSGAAPTHAGVVWTDGGAGVTVVFEAFDGQGNSLGTVSASDHVDGSNYGETAEDRFYGVVSPDGVGSIVIKSTGGIEVDHLQWGR